MTVITTASRVKLPRRVMAKAIPRAVPSGMNKTEAAYRDELEARKLAGVIQEYGYQSVTLKLANDTRYTPDFMVIAADGTVELHEVKGFWRDDAKVKVKVAARQFPFRFIVVMKVKGFFVAESFTEGEVA